MAIIAESFSYLMLIAGALLVMAEAIIPGAQFIVIGISLLMTGLVSVIAPFGGILLLIVTFFLTAVVTVYGYNYLDLYGESQGSTSDSDTLDYQEGIVKERVTQEDGVIEITSSNIGFGSTFQARSPTKPIPEGTEVIVTDSSGGSILEVVPLDAGISDIEAKLQEEDNVEKETETN